MLIVEMHDVIAWWLNNLKKIIKLQWIKLQVSSTETTYWTNWRNDSLTIVTFVVSDSSLLIMLITYEFLQNYDKQLKSLTETSTKCWNTLYWARRMQPGKKSASQSLERQRQERFCLISIWASAFYRALKYWISLSYHNMRHIFTQIKSTHTIYAAWFVSRHKLRISRRTTFARYFRVRFHAAR